MDKKNQRIIEILQQDGRISLAELSKLVHLSAPAVAERLKRLEEQNVIKGYKATVNNSAVGLPIQAIVRVKPFSGNEPKLFEYVKQNTSISKAYNVTGEYAAVLEVAVSNMTMLDKLLEDLSTLGESDTSVVLSELTNKPVPLDQ